MRRRIEQSAGADASVPPDLAVLRHADPALLGDLAFLVGAAHAHRDARRVLGELGVGPRLDAWPEGGGSRVGRVGEGMGVGSRR